MKVKNNTDQVDSWAGQQIDPGSYYSIENLELSRWQNDSKVLSDIASGKLLVNNEISDILDIAKAINTLKQIDAVPKDSDGAPLQRVKITTSGWSFQLHGFEFETSTVNSIYSKTVNGSDHGFVSVKFYKLEENVETEMILTGTDEEKQADLDANCIKTVIDWEPQHDYEIVGGTLKQKTVPSEDIRLWIVGVPDVPDLYGGSKVFVTNANLSFIGLEEGVRADGRAPKYLQYNSQMHTNKLRIILRHSPGFKHKLHMIFEIFKP